MIRVVLVTLLISLLSSCQSVPAERKNNCACMWEPLSGLPEGQLS